MHDYVKQPLTSSCITQKSKYMTLPSPFGSLTLSHDKCFINAVHIIILFNLWLDDNELFLLATFLLHFFYIFN